MNVVKDPAGFPQPGWADLPGPDGSRIRTCSRSSARSRPPWRDWRSGVAPCPTVKATVVSDFRPYLGGDKIDVGAPS